MQSYLLFLTLLALLFSAGCSSNKESTQNQPEPSGPEPVEPAPAPGTAVVNAEILRIAQLADNSYRLTLRVNGVEAYGASTKPIAQDSEITVEVGSQAYETFEQRLVTGTEVTAALAEVRGGPGTSEKSTNWKLRSIKSLNDAQ